MSVTSGLVYSLVMELGGTGRGGVSGEEFLPCDVLAREGSAADPTKILMNDKATKKG